MRHFIFDLDGTLIDTEKPVLMTWQQTLSEDGFAFSLESLRVVLGIPLQDGLERLEVQTKPGFANRWKQNYTRFAPEAQFFPGAEEMLSSLREKGYEIGVVSSRDRAEYTAFFSRFGLEKFVGTVILAEDTSRHKPDPEPLLAYMKTTGAKPAECIYIGDMPGDILCANQAGVASGLALWNHSGVMCEEAKFVFHHVEDVVRL